MYLSFINKNPISKSVVNHNSMILKLLSINFRTMRKVAKVKKAKRTRRRKRTKRRTRKERERKEREMTMM